MKETENEYPEGEGVAKYKTSLHTSAEKGHVQRGKNTTFVPSESQQTGHVAYVTGIPKHHDGHPKELKAAIKDFHKKRDH